MTFARTLASAATLLAMATALHAQEGPAVIFDLGGKFDNSFNQASFEGAERFKKETGDRVPRVRAPVRRPARAGAAPLRRAGQQPDRHRRLLLRERDGDGRGRVPRHPVRHHRRGRRPAERALGGLQRARGQLPRRHARGAGVRDRQGRLRRRHGHPADPQVRLRLRPGRQGGEPRRRGLPEHDRHDRRGLERPGQGRRARQEPDRPAAPTSSTTPPAAPASACSRPRPTRACWASASTRTRTTCIPARS